MKHIAIVVSFIMLSVNLSGCAFVAGLGAVTAVKTAYDNRSLGHQFDDKSIEWRLHAKIMQEKRLSQDARIRVFSYNDQVLLVGQTTTAKERKLVGRIAAQFPMVSKVFNELRVAPKIDFKQIGEDTWITSQIKIKLMAKKDLNPLGIKVITEDGEVFIVGTMNAQQTHQAVEVARHVSGVKTVYHLIEGRPS